MKNFSIIPILLLLASGTLAQTNSYEISFPNAVHHEAVITATFNEVKTDTLEVRMSRSSPGRYALHEFAKNVYGFEATDGRGRALKINRNDPYSWLLTGHNGTVNIRYLLYADRGDGTYSQIDETHAHLNMPATFMYAPSLSERAIEVTFIPRADFNWKIATQLPTVSGNTYRAPDLQYFMDSPTELSNFAKKTFTTTSNGREYSIEFVLHHQGDASSFDTYFEQVKKIVEQEELVFGEFPQYDYGRYTFLACYMPQVSGDGMEHRNSTILTTTRALENGGISGNISTVAHEFFHSWNVERLRPKTLEPFNFEKANMSGALWFAEGFTSYYTDLVLCRAGIITEEAYISGLTRSFNYVWTSPGRMFNNPIEMSFRAPFEDAATSIDPQNSANIFISYYTYGSMLGLALDLSLRQHQLSLDGYMRLLWATYGSKAVPYTLQNLHESLNQYAGRVFGDHFFNNYIYMSGMPDYQELFESVGIVLSKEPENAVLGAWLASNNDGKAYIKNNTLINSPAYKAGLEQGDILVSLNGQSLDSGDTLVDSLKLLEVGDSILVGYIRNGQEHSTNVILEANPYFTILSEEASGTKPSAATMERRKNWLTSE